MNRTTLYAFAALLAFAPASAAQRRSPRGRAPAPAPAATPETPDLEPPSVATPDGDTLIEAIQAAAVAGTADGARSISLLILRGVPPRVAAEGLDALGVLARPEGASAVLRFLEHRRVSLRRHAVAAAQAIRTPALVRALAGKLSDSDEDVRVEAAVALAEVGNASVAPALFAAFERDLENSGGRLAHEAALAIGRVGSAEDITRLLASLRRAPFRTMSEALRPALARRDLPDAVKLRVVTAVGDLATREAREFLNAVINDARGRETPVVRAARTAAERIAE
jgi:HEAT repeat protein